MKQFLLLVSLIAFVPYCCGMREQLNLERTVGSDEQLSFLEAFMSGNLLAHEGNVIFSHYDDSELKYEESLKNSYQFLTKIYHIKRWPIMQWQEISIMQEVDMAQQSNSAEQKIVAFIKLSTPQFMLEMQMKRLGGLIRNRLVKKLREAFAKNNAEAINNICKELQQCPFVPLKKALEEADKEIIAVTFPEPEKAQIN